MKVNGIEIVGNEFAYEGCHKIYIIEDIDDRLEAIDWGYEILPIEKLPDIWNDSCPLRFISNWALNIHYVPQFEEVIFER